MSNNNPHRRRLGRRFRAMRLETLEDRQLFAGPQWEAVQFFPARNVSTFEPVILLRINSRPLFASELKAEGESSEAATDPRDSASPNFSHHAGATTQDSAILSSAVRGEPTQGRGEEAVIVVIVEPKSQPTSISNNTSSSPTVNNAFGSPSTRLPIPSSSQSSGNSSNPTQAISQINDRVPIKQAVATVADLGSVQLVYGAFDDRAFGASKMGWSQTTTVGGEFSPALRSSLTEHSPSLQQQVQRSALLSPIHSSDDINWQKIDVAWHTQPQILDSAFPSVTSGRQLDDDSAHKSVIQSQEATQPDQLMASWEWFSPLGLAAPSNIGPVAAHLVGIAAADAWIVEPESQQEVPFIPPGALSPRQQLRDRVLAALNQTEEPESDIAFERWLSSRWWSHSRVASGCLIVLAAGIVVTRYRGSGRVSTTTERARTT